MEDGPGALRIAIELQRSHQPQELNQSSTTSREVVKNLSRTRWTQFKGV
jgi:hypothetical protein